MKKLLVLILWSTVTFFTILAVYAAVYNPVIYRTIVKANGLWQASISLSWTGAPESPAWFIVYKTQTGIYLTWVVEWREELVGSGYSERQNITTFLDKNGKCDFNTELYYTYEVDVYDNFGWTGSSLPFLVTIPKCPKIIMPHISPPLR